ncbi:MAG: molybdenum cofactor biosynthesis protein MoaE [Rhodothermales bacterium]|nr:molybdenum cofactor biosynthesis protein MoaE [Rhodothermales bacterium]MBO6781535.1 molybdenum cofactor biosynthesis protein MoaE [Rhodothermales bacterium]
MAEIRHADRWFLVTEETLDPGSAHGFLRDPACGGVNVFVGTTRAVTGDVRTLELRYEAYAEMALDEMARLVELASEQWPVRKAVLMHRTGVVRPTEASVVVGVCTPHRDEAFAACRFLIDELKLRVPVWKKEQYADGRTEWVEPGKED